MKYSMIRLSFLVLFVAFVGMQGVSAQAKTTANKTTKKKKKPTKLGHLNKALILSQMPAVKQAQVKIEERRKQMLKQLENEAKALQTRYQKAMQDVQEKKLTEAQIKQEEQALMQMQRSLAQRERDMEQQLLKRQEQLLKPIAKQVDDAIKAVANKYGYYYLLDSSSGIILHMPDYRDVTNLVKKELGMKVTPKKQ